VIDVKTTAPGLVSGDGTAFPKPLMLQCLGTFNSDGDIDLDLGLRVLPWPRRLVVDRPQEFLVVIHVVVAGDEEELDEAARPDATTADSQRSDG